MGGKAWGCMQGNSAICGKAMRSALEERVSKHGWMGCILRDAAFAASRLR
jgi:hypothetical protein